MNPFPVGPYDFEKFWTTKTDEGWYPLAKPFRIHSAYEWWLTTGQWRGLAAWDRHPRGKVLPIRQWEEISFFVRGVDWDTGRYEEILTRDEFWEHAMEVGPRYIGLRRARDLQDELRRRGVYA